MNPFDLSASDLLIWGIVLHLIADWPLQNDWMANNKMKRQQRHNPTTMSGERGTLYDVWWYRHPAAYVHAGIHGILLAFVFGWVAVPLAIIHLIVDTRAPVVWWSKLMGQAQPQGEYVEPAGIIELAGYRKPILLYDIGTEVRIWNDQVFHIACIAVAALLIA